MNVDELFHQFGTFFKLQVGLGGGREGLRVRVGRSSFGMMCEFEFEY